MASLKEIAREYRDEIMDGIAWVAIGRLEEVGTQKPSG